jgi:hypothetical protein
MAVAEKSVTPYSVFDVQRFLQTRVAKCTRYEDHMLGMTGLAERELLCGPSCQMGAQHRDELPRGEEP